jgi:LDH2 family malate/lactate/ureidoglycolate dehydrogenase
VQPVPGTDILIQAGALRTFSAEMFVAAGVLPKHAALIADSLIAANLRAVDSHGVHLLRPYIEAIQRGNINIHAEGCVAVESGSMMLYDGQNGLGQVISAEACDHAVRLSSKYGAGIVTVRDSNHFGAAAYWAQRIASNGMIGLAMCNATPLVAPWQGREKRLGTNPICMAAPGPNTWLLDMATTTVALNRIWKAKLTGETSIPDGWAMDRNGRPTNDIDAALEGLPMPLGGYKGTGLAVMVEIFCGILSGGAMATELGGLRVKTRPMRTSHCFIAIDVSRLMPLDQFVERMVRLREIITSTAPADGYDEVLMAGDPEWRAERERSRNGIPIPKELRDTLVELAAELGVTPPPEFSNG